MNAAVRAGKSIGHSTGTVDMYAIQSEFGVDKYGRPTPKMATSLLYKLVSFQAGSYNRQSSPFLPALYASLSGFR